MRNHKLLDCSLRDGGYVNDWNFGHGVLDRILARLVSSKVEIIEVGFLDERRPFNIDYSIMPTTECAEKIFGMIDKGDSIVVGMIDYGTCPIENLQNCSDSYLDGIRVIFKKEIMHEAIEYCKKVQKLGYLVFANCVSITSYNDNELRELINLINEFNPYAVALVDTYGLLHQDNLMHYFEIMNAELNPQIGLAYHGHNNFQMGYANAISFMNHPTDRMLIVDGTLYGFGKGAGNAPLELLAMYMNERYGKQYNISQMLEAIYSDIMDIYNLTPWGYKPFFYIAASNKCHPNYVSYLMDKKTLSVKSVNELLKLLAEEKKLLFDKSYIEGMYLQYQRKECDDTQTISRLTRELQGKTVLMIGPGKSVRDHATEIRTYIASHNPVVIPINYIPNEFKPDYLFISNSKRYGQLTLELHNPQYIKPPIIATSNIVSVKGDFDYILNYSSLIDPNTDIPDNSMIMLMRTLAKIGVKNVALAGFDGYVANEMNYMDTNMEYSFVSEKADYLNCYAKKYFSDNQHVLNIQFVTPSHYQE